MACVQIYLCSNPEDSVVERRLLRESVFPKLREYCRRMHGVDFRVIDPYEAADPKKWCLQRARLQLLEDCRKYSLGPFFVGLVGEQYGDACLPEQIEVSEFQCLLLVCERMGLRTDILKRCYRRDENAIPPSFVHIKHYGIQQENPTEENDWFEVLPEVRRILQDVVKHCIQEGTMTHDKSQKYFRSALDIDIRFAYEDPSTKDNARCLCYVHKINFQRKANRLLPEEQAQSDRLSQLRDHFLPSLVASHKALVYCLTTESNCWQGCLPEMRLNFAVGLSEQLHTDLKGLIDRAISKREQASAVDKFGQKDLCRIFSSLYRIERAEIKHVKAYLEERNTKFPFVLNGRPCSGKTVLLAHCASQASIWLKDLDPVIIVYFIDINSSLRQLLKALCESLASGHKHLYSTCLNDIFQLKENFKRLLTANLMSRNPLVLIIDGLDQLPVTDGPLDLTWLPKSLPPNVKLLISFTANSPAIFSTLKIYYPESTLFCELQPVESKSCSQLLTTLLQASNRKITSGQQVHVNQAFKKCSIPLNVELLHKQSSLWSSEFEITENMLVQGIHNKIVLMFDHLERKHGKALVSRALSYLTLARYGMTAAELTDVLSCDDEVLASFLPQNDCIPLSLRVPEVSVESLLFDLKGFLELWNIWGTQILFWVSRHFPLAICKKYLCSMATRQKLHHVLSVYFSGSWADAKAKPLIFDEELKFPGSLDKTQKIYSDRQVPSQPWIFCPPSFMSTAISSKERTHANLRKLHELPFHLLKSGRLEELGNLMTSQVFLQAMLQAMMGDELLLWLERTSQLFFPRKLQLLSIILRSSACLLWNNPADLPSVLQAKLLPFLSVYPTLEECIYPARSDDVIRRKGLNSVLSPVPLVPYTHCTLNEPKASQITHSAGSHSGTVVVVLENGAAWVCHGGVFEASKLPESSHLQFTSVSSCENIFLLSSHCGKLVLWDTNAPTRPQEIQTRHTEKGESSILEGFLVSNDKIFVWWKGQNVVNIFVEREEHTQLHCIHEITCVSCSEDGNIIYCGQNESSVTIFDWVNGQILATFTCPKKIPLIDMIHVSESDGLITCIDEAGNVFAWNLEIITEPVLISETHCRTLEKVLNIDHKRDNLLLVCKRQQIQLIDIHQMDVLDQLNPPKGKTFRIALMDQDSHFILGLLSNCPFLLVWNCASGQCVLSLDTNGQASNLLNCGAIYLAAITNSGVLIWDMDLITASAMAPKSGKRVEMVVVGCHGKSCYSTDGSEFVWKWEVLKGKVEGYFFHHGSVESMSISADGDYLVTIATRDIYVWDTNSGKNLHRISGSQAYNVLITPKGNTGVALSETGPSRIWKLQSGQKVCSIHLHLRNAIISPEGTFLFGINTGDLLAVSLWSGNVSKRFSCSDRSDVVAFHSLLNHPDYVIVASATGALYSWRITDDTICHQFQLPDSFLCQPEIFRLSSDGDYAILSITESTINILDISKSMLCSLRTEGPVQQPYVAVGISNQYVVYICYSSLECQNVFCDLHEKPILVVVRMSDGETVGRFYLCKNTSTLTVSDDLLVFVGFEDGSVGVYAVNDIKMSNTNCNGDGQSLIPLCPLDESLVWVPLVNPNLTWVELASVKYF
ncbi:NACHT and WD repeat domain-containing protein 2 [Myxocyprinus asiaticus]|uniref:NACHT and WD repeat domain-containing protein 2 n=1 Tax=Myxocyprinus asiaticus TaxID=70543 RepID=UPI002221E296|nr:NACHT and WD repeat domain-containing protein 2 [Myxocyprinus asiaticus]